MIRFKLLGVFVDKTLEVRFMTVVLQITDDDIVIAQVLQAQGLVEGIGQNLYKYKDTDRELSFSEYIRHVSLLYKTLYDINLKNKGSLDLAISLQLSDFERHMQDKLKVYCRQLATTTKKAMMTNLGDSCKILSNFKEEENKDYLLNNGRLYLNYKGVLTKPKTVEGSSIYITDAEMVNMEDLYTLFAYSSITIDVSKITCKNFDLQGALSVIRSDSIKREGDYIVLSSSSFLDLKHIRSFIMLCKSYRVKLGFNTSSHGVNKLQEVLKANNIHPYPTEGTEKIYMDSIGIFGDVSLIKAPVRTSDAGVIIPYLLYSFTNTVSDRAVFVTEYCLRNYLVDCEVTVSAKKRAFIIRNARGVNLSDLWLKGIKPMLYNELTTSDVDIEVDSLKDDVLSVGLLNSINNFILSDSQADITDYGILVKDTDKGFAYSIQ